MDNVNYEGLISVYLDLRNMKAELKEEYERKLKPVEEKMDRIESVLNGELNRLGVKNIATKTGTVLRTTWTRVNVTDWDKIRDYIVKNNRFDMLEKRLAKTVVLDAIKQLEEDNLPPIPGVSIETGLQVAIRKA